MNRPCPVSELEVLARALRHRMIEPLAVYPLQFGIGGSVVEVEPELFAMHVTDGRRPSLRREGDRWLIDLGRFWLATRADWLDLTP